MLAVLAVILLYISSLLPTMRIALAVIAGLATAVALIECGFLHATLLYVTVSVLGLLILPVKGTAILYALFFGYYPILKSLAERPHSRVIEWLLKLAILNIALTAAWLLYMHGFLDGITLPAVAVYVLYAACNVVFVLYDIGFSKLISVYFVRIKRRKGQKL